MMKRCLLSAAAAIGLFVVPALAQEQLKLVMSGDRSEPVSEQRVAADQNEAIRQLTTNKLLAL